MKILNATQIKQADRDTLFLDAISSVDLMERAGTGCVEHLTARYPHPLPVAVFAGKGNNGGDGMVIARLLARKNYPVTVYLLSEPEKLSPDARVQYEKLAESKPDLPVRLQILHAAEFPSLTSETLIIDALLGTGITKPAEGFYSEIISGINNCKNEVVSIDLPSGLPCSPGDFRTNGNIIRADLTLTLQQPKLSLLLSDFGDYTKELEIIDIELKTERIPEKEVLYYWVTEKEIKPLIKTRERFSHKGNYGHALLIAGSYGKMGAAVLSAEACLRTGAGLLSVHAPRSGNQILQTTVPEAMCTPCHQTFHVAGLPVLTPYTAIGAGPGIGTSAETGRCLHRLLQKTKVPLILDADAINLLGQNREWLPLLPARTILTPHPREFERLTEPASSAYDRLLKQKAFSEKQGVILVLKGACTSVSFPDGRIFFNSTGNPGMATAGSGDVLTGIILSLLTRGYDPEQAALLGVFLHGLSGDIAVGNTGQESLMARDLIENIKNATIRLKP